MNYLGRFGESSPALAERTDEGNVDCLLQGRNPPGSALASETAKPFPDEPQPLLAPGPHCRL